MALRSEGRFVDPAGAVGAVARFLAEPLLAHTVYIDWCLAVPQYVRRG